MTNTTNAAPVTPDDVAAAYIASQTASRALLDAQRPILAFRDVLAADGPITADALAVFAAAVVAADAAIMAGDAAAALFERTPPDVFAAGMRLAWDQRGDS